MLALAGQAAPFDQGREQMKLLAGLEVATKAVERTAEAIGEGMAQREQQQIQQALQSDLGRWSWVIPFRFCMCGWMEPDSR
jgi:hypothetical protein